MRAIRRCPEQDVSVFENKTPLVLWGLTQKCSLAYAMGHNDGAERLPPLTGRNVCPEMEASHGCEDGMAAAASCWHIT